MAAVVAGPFVKFAVRSMVAAGRLIQRFPQVARPAGGFWLVRLLRLEAGPAQVTVEDRGGDLLCEDGRRSRPARPVLLAAGMLGREHDRFGSYLGLVDGRHRLRVAR